MSSVPSRRVPCYRMAVWLAAIMLMVATFATGCSTSVSSVDAFAENQKILASCDAAHPPASWVALDATGSGAAKRIFAERMTALESIVRETAVCSGVLKVTVFTSSSTATATVFDGPLRQRGATENARLRRVPKAVADTMATIRNVYGSTAARLEQHQSDVTGQYRVAGEWLRQLGGSYAPRVYLLTDGFQTVGINLTAQARSPQQAEALAQHVRAPRLPGATVVVAGLGRVAGPPPPSKTVEGLVAFYDELCHRMAAARCIAVSDYQAVGW